MLSPYDWALTVRVLYNLARMWPQLTDAATPRHPPDPAGSALADAGPYATRCREFAWGRATYPLQAKAAPVVVFSGGAAADGTGYEVLLQHWASHGICVLQCVHTDAYACQLERAGHPLVAWFKVVWYIWGLVLGDVAPWRARVQDITGLINNLEAVAQTLNVPLDTERVGVGGYSYGGKAALLLGGAAHYHRGRCLLWQDKRVRAALAISPENGAKTTPRTVWNGLTAPFMILTGDRDGDVLGRSWLPKAEAFLRAPASVRELCVIPGASHFAFSGRLLDAVQDEQQLTAQRAIFGTVKARTLEFWLKNL